MRNNNKFHHNWRGEWENLTFFIFEFGSLVWRCKFIHKYEIRRERKQVERRKFMCYQQFSSSTEFPAKKAEKKFIDFRIEKKIEMKSRSFPALCKSLREDERVKKKFSLIIELLIFSFEYSHSCHIHMMAIMTCVTWLMMWWVRKENGKNFYRVNSIGLFIYQT